MTYQPGKFIHRISKQCNRKTGLKGCWSDTDRCNCTHNIAGFIMLYISTYVFKYKQRSFGQLLCCFHRRGFNDRYFSLQDTTLLCNHGNALIKVKTSLPLFFIFDLYSRKFPSYKCRFCFSQFQ